MRVVLAGLGSREDVQPLVALGRFMRGRGHEAVVATSGVFAGWVREQGLEFALVGSDIEGTLQDCASLAHQPTRAMKHLLDLARAELDLHFEHTFAAAAGADLIVSGIHPAAPSVAEALGVPHRTLLYCPQWLPSREHPPMTTRRFPFPTFANSLLWSGVRFAFDSAFKAGVNRHRVASGLAPARNLLSHLLTDRAIVASDPLLGELPSDAPSTIVQTGALLLHDDTPLDPELERFLDAGDPPVYIGFGNMPDDDPPSTMRTLVEALEACGRRGVILSNWAGFGEDPPESVFASNAANLSKLLPRVALTVHHGAAAITAQAARAGAPQIVVPHVADQFYWADRLHELGVGYEPIARRWLGARRLTKAIQDLMKREEAHANARQLKLALEDADGVAETACMLLHEVEAGEAARDAA